MCLINFAHEHFITQTGKKSKPALINFMGPGERGAEEPRTGIWGRGPRKTNNLNHFTLKQYREVHFTRFKIFLLCFYDAYDVNL